MSRIEAGGVINPVSRSPGVGHNPKDIVTTLQAGRVGSHPKVRVSLTRSEPCKV